MAQKGKLKISNRYQEIVQLLQKARGENGNFLWKVVVDQMGDEQRHKFSFVIHDIDSRHSRITVEVNEATARGLQPGDQVYFKLKPRNSAFKATVLSCEDGHVTTSFPEEAAVTELRELKRYYFHPVDEKYVQLKKLREGSTGRVDRQHHLLVCDVSQGGLCLFVPDSQIGALEVRSRIKLEALGPFRLETPILGEVVFKAPFSIKEALGAKPGTRIGIQLEGKIPLAIFDRFIVKKQVLSVSDERIVLDEKFRSKVHENMSEIRSALAKNKRLEKFFDNLNIPKAGNQYLRQHIEMLCEVLCGLAVRVGWVSEKSIDKLIYVAFLHDIRFTQYPKLAQIPSLVEYEEQKRYLSDNERKAYLEAPLYAAEIARQDLEAYPDAIKILAQQKELPDGTGFPHQLTASQLAPLSCLFIVAHYFVDYVVDHPDWSIDDFVKTYSRKFKGQYFQKIFEVMG